MSAAKRDAFSAAIGKRIQELLELRGESQSSFAERCGLTPGNFWSKTGGHSRIYAENLVVFADALGVTTDQLLGREKLDMLQAAKAPSPPSGVQEEAAGTRSRLPARSVLPPDGGDLHRRSAPPSTTPSARSPFPINGDGLAQAAGTAASGGRIVKGEERKRGLWLDGNAQRRLHELAQEMRVSLADMAEELGCSPQRISGIWNGRSCIRRFELEKLAALLDADAAWILGEQNERFVPAARSPGVPGLYKMHKLSNGQVFFNPVTEHDVLKTAKSILDRRNKA